jgi:hypothetical protein
VALGWRNGANRPGSCQLQHSEIEQEWMPDDPTIVALRGNHVPMLKTRGGYHRHLIHWRKRRLVAQEERSAKDR